MSALTKEMVRLVSSKDKYMGFINFRGGQKADNFDEISEAAKKAEAAEQDAIGSHRLRVAAADFFGVPELAEKENKAILAQLLIRKKGLDAIHEALTLENKLASEFDDTQLMKDFLVRSISEILDQGTISGLQRTKALQLISNVFQIDNPISAAQYYFYIENNDAYSRYMDRCFDISDSNMPEFWRWLQHLGNQPVPNENGTNRMDIVIYFMQEYLMFMMALSFYFSQIFPGRRCGVETREMLQKHLEIISRQMVGRERKELDISLLVNPIFADPADVSADYSGYEQDRNQSEGLQGAFARLKRRFKKRDKVREIVWLLDMCNSSEENILENEYKRITQSF